MSALLTAVIVSESSSGRRSFPWCYVTALLSLRVDELFVSPLRRWVCVMAACLLFLKAFTSPALTPQALTNIRFIHISVPLASSWAHEVSRFIYRVYGETEAGWFDLSTNAWKWDFGWLFSSRLIKVFCVWDVEEAFSLCHPRTSYAGWMKLCGAASWPLTSLRTGVNTKAASSTLINEASHDHRSNRSCCNVSSIISSVFFFCFCVSFSFILTRFFVFPLKKKLYFCFLCFFIFFSCFCFS